MPEFNLNKMIKQSHISDHQKTNLHGVIKESKETKAIKQRPRVKMSELVGGGYGKFWNFKGRYRVVKGSRASKKSKTMALWTISNIMKYSAANMLVVRKYATTLRDSVFLELKWAIKQMGVQGFWKVKENPLEMVYIPTGQKILFRGLDSDLKITSITVDVGCLCWLWVEEAYEIDRESDFDTINESIRGTVPKGLFKQATLTLNPWNESWWGKKRFFDAENSDDVLAITTTYKCNEWLDDADKKLFEDMRVRNYKRYRTAGLAEWGIEEGLIYDRWDIMDFDYKEVMNRNNKCRLICGLDWGYNDPNTFIPIVVDNENKELFIFGEIYKPNVTNPQFYSIINKVGLAKERTIADNAEPKSIAQMKDLGMTNIKPSRKGHDSVNFGINVVRDFMIHIVPDCKHVIEEISNYRWETTSKGVLTGKPDHKYSHTMDAIRYAVVDVAKPARFSFV